MISPYGYLAAWILLQSVSWFWTPDLHPVLEFLNNLWGLGLGTEALKVHKREKFFVSDFEFLTILKLVKLKY